MVYLPRRAQRHLNRALEGDKVVIVLGARQVGKTTLVEHVLKDAHALYLNFDVDIDKQRFLAASALAPLDALKSLGSPEIVVIDEAQRLPEATRIVKGWHDTRLPAKLVLLGSSSLNLLDQTAESLTGRNEKIMLPALMLEEALQSQSWFCETYARDVLCTQFARPLHTFLLENMAFGSYPEIVLADDRPSLLRNLSSDYLWKDILQTGMVKTPEVIRRLLTLLAHQVGAEVSVHELAVQLQMARPTVDRYLDLLEQTYVIFRLPAFSTNPRKEISKGRKIYFWDTGIRNALLNAFSTQELRPDIGALWENWVIAEIAKRNLLDGLPAQLYFWRTRAQSEVDLVVKTGTDLRAFEIKWRRGTVRQPAWRDAYGTEVQLLEPGDPLVGSRALG